MGRLLKPQSGAGTCTHSPLTEANLMAKVSFRGAGAPTMNKSRNRTEITLSVCGHGLGAGKQRRHRTLNWKFPPTVSRRSGTIANIPTRGPTPVNLIPREGQPQTYTSCGNLDSRGGEGGRKEGLSWGHPPPLSLIRIHRMSEGLAGGQECYPNECPSKWKHEEQKAGSSLSTYSYTWH